jgi:hypothetical protein
MTKHIARHHLDINIEKTLSQIVFSHVEQPTKSKFMLGRGNQEVSAYSREKSVSLELIVVTGYKYPHLFAVSIFIVGIPATSVPSESVFKSR